MKENIALIEKFYTAFQQRDYYTMQACYADNAIFTDEAFIHLNATEVRAMWEMLIKRGTDLELSYSNITATDNTAAAHWVASYTFSATGRKVINRIDACFEIKDGKIIKHTDSFSFYKWSSQALGLPGLLLGWTKFFQQKVQQKAKISLQAYMNKQGNETN
jgi:ketosteroid isomerase-like protein